MEDGGCDEPVSFEYGPLDTWWGFIPIWRGTGNVGGMIGGDIVHEDSFPHGLFGWGIIV